MFELEKAMTRRSYRDLNKIARKGQILFTGSSLMEQFPVNEIAMSQGIDKIIYNRGIGGTTTDEFLQHIDTVLLDPDHPECSSISAPTTLPPERTAHTGRIIC